MTVQEVIRAVDALKPNGYTMAQKTAWIEDMEAELWREVFLRSDSDGAAATGSERALLLPESWKRLYHMYLAAMIDFSNAEYTKYSNAMAAYNGAWAGFAAWYAERYAPADRPAVWAKAAAAAYDDTAVAGITLPRGAAVLAAVCQVDEAFGAADCVLMLGTARKPAALLGAADIQPGTKGRYGRRGLFLPEGGDERLYARVAGANTSGAAQFAVLIQPGKE